MKMNLSGKFNKYKSRTSKRGNEYKVVNIVQDGHDKEYFNCMIDKNAYVDTFPLSDEVLENYVDKNVVFELDYKPQYKSFMITGIKSVENKEVNEYGE